MNKLMQLLILLISINLKAQFPITEEFNTGTSWSYTNGAGLQNYGGAENYATFNIGSTPYPNNATVTITSPIYSFTNCSSNITVGFPISGRIESNLDYMYFQYFNSGIWNTIDTFTGIQNTTTSYSVPNTTTRFRFMLITDCSVNGYKGGNPSCSLLGYTPSCTPAPGNCSGLVSVYYYDITRVTIGCSTILPIELVEFSVNQEDCINKIQWTTLSEMNNDHFELERSNDAINFKVINRMNGSNNSNNMVRYLYYDKEPLNEINYYRLKQYDIDGKINSSNIISISNTCNREKYQKIINLLGQEVTEDYRGPKLYIYNNKIIKRIE